MSQVSNDVMLWEVTDISTPVLLLLDILYLVYQVYTSSGKVK